jgi:hypothetical protein
LTKHWPRINRTRVASDPLHKIHLNMLFYLNRTFNLKRSKRG